MLKTRDEGTESSALAVFLFLKKKKMASELGAVWKVILFVF
jgi:hypothetical protein